MSDEIKITNNNGHDENNHEHDEKCFCKSKGFKKFLTIALGTFVGVYCALCLFSALHKPPMIMGPQGGFGGAPIARPCPCKTMHHYHIKHNNLEPREMQDAHGRTAPFEVQGPINEN